MGQQLELGRAIRQADYLYERERRYDFEGVFWNSLYGIGIIGLGWVAVKTGVLIADVQRSTMDMSRSIQLTALNTEITNLEMAISAKSPTFAALPTWMIAISPFSALVTKVWDWLRVTADDPAVDEELAVMAAELEGLYADRIALMEPVEASESGTTRLVRKADVVYGRFGPIAPVGILGFNALNEMIRVRRMEAEAG